MHHSIIVAVSPEVWTGVLEGGWEDGMRKVVGGMLPPMNAGLPLILMLGGPPAGVGGPPAGEESREEIWPFVANEISAALAEGEVARDVLTVRTRLEMPEGAEGRGKGPIRVIEAATLGRIAAQGTIVIVEGPGVPVAKQRDRDTDTAPKGVETVVGVTEDVDPGRAAVLLGRGAGAEHLIFAGPIGAVSSEYGGPAATPLRTLTPGRVEKMLGEQEVPPQIAEMLRAALDFLAYGGREAHIGPSDGVSGMLAGALGTSVIPESRREGEGGGGGGDGSPEGAESFEDSAVSPGFRLTNLFLQRNPRYRHLLSLTPEHYRFDPVLWHSSISALRAMLRALAEEEGISVSEEDLTGAVENLVEGVVRESHRWEP